jgi:hypothetical protein
VFVAARNRTLCTFHLNSIRVFLWVILGMEPVHKRPKGASGTPSNWATWWIMDDGDDADSLRAADIEGQLNQAVEQLVAERIPMPRGEFPAVRPILTGDGKAMLAANFRENGSGGRQ